MTTETLRRDCSILLLGAVLGLAACAHVPAGRGGAVPPKVTVTLGPAPDATGATPGTSGPAQSPNAPPPISALVPSDVDASPAPVAGINPQDYSDLFDRMRAGFELEDADRSAVARELDWFVANPDYVQRAFQRSSLYLYHIVTQLESRGMPLELALLPVIESAFEPYAYSRARAVGLWQFIPGTGSRFGLKQNWWYDGRRDVIESTRAALDYLQYLHDEFNGDWLLAIAAYNCGEDAVARAVRSNQQQGRPIDFWSLRLPVETRAYVPKLLAMKRLVSSPETFGLTISPIPNRPYFARVDTLGQVDLRVAAEIAGLSTDVIYELNPAYHRWATDPSGPYELLLPTDAATVFSSNLGQLTPDERMRIEHYTVRHGDSVARIARRFSTSPQVVRELNSLPSGALTVGADLRVPADVAQLPAKVLQAAAHVDSRDRRMWRPSVRVVVHRGDSLWTIARRHGMDVHTLALLNGMQPGDTLHAGQHLRLVSTTRATSVDSASLRSRAFASRQLTYVVRAGDTLLGIAQLFQVSVAELQSWNRIAHTALHPGERLHILLAAR